MFGVLPHRPNTTHMMPGDPFQSTHIVASLEEQSLGPSAVGISVAPCTWNGAEFIDSFLDGLAAQSRQPDELVVQDDRSVDGTVELILQRASELSFEVLVEINPVHVGSTANFEKALGRCRGRFIALADQDDIWGASKLQRTVGELERDPTLTLAFSDAHLIDRGGRPIGRSLWSTRQIHRVLTKHEVVPEALFATRALSTGCTMVIRRRAAEAAIPFPAELSDELVPMRHDRWISLVAAAVGTACAIPEPLMSFRVHNGQETGVLVGVQLPVELLRVVRSVLNGADRANAKARLGRAAQLEVAADRADLLGDFFEADAVRRVAARIRLRASTAPTLRGRMRLMTERIRLGAYSPSAAGIAALGADLIRSLRPDAHVT